MDPILKLALETLVLNKQAIIFCPNRSSAEKTAEEIAPLTKAHYPEFEKAVLQAASTPTKQCRRLSHIIRKGVAFHHAGLLSKQKELIEEEFRAGNVKIICATPTLAAGLSLPVFRVVIKSLKRYSGRWGMDWIPVLEYLQMAGRAGRPEYEAYGEAITIAKTETERDEIYERYVCGEPEEIYSKLAVEPVLRTYLLSLISSGIIRDGESMRAFFLKTFWAHQFQDMEKLERVMEKMLQLLVQWGFVVMSGGEVSPGEFVAASSLQRRSSQIYQATLLGRRVSELYLDPLTARHILDCLERYDKIDDPHQGSFSLLQMIGHTLEMRPLLQVKAKESDVLQEELVKRYDSLLESEPSAYDAEYDEFLNSIKTALFFESWIDEKDEEFLLEKYGILPGEIHSKLGIADWLLYAAQELALVSHVKPVLRPLAQLRIRVKQGVREELLPLLKLQGIGRKRARTLFLQGIKDLGDVKTADLTTLSQLLGRAVAEDVKKQLGEEVVAISERKRTGQMSLGKY